MNQYVTFMQIPVFEPNHSLVRALCMTIAPDSTILFVLDDDGNGVITSWAPRVIESNSDAEDKRILVLKDSNLIFIIYLRVKECI